MSKKKYSEETYANAIFQNAKTGMQSIHDILPKVTDKKLKAELKDEYFEFNKVAEKVIAYAYDNRLPLKDNTFFEKARMWTSVKMSTIFNPFPRNIAQLLLLGTVMGLATTYKDRSDHKGVSVHLDDILNELEDTLENNYKNLKEFLKTL